MKASGFVFIRVDIGEDPAYNRKNSVDSCDLRELCIADDCGSWGQTADVVLYGVGMADVIDDVADGVDWVEW